MKTLNFNAKSPMPAFPFPEGYPMAATQTRNPGLMAQQLAAAKIEKVDTFHTVKQLTNLIRTKQNRRTRQDVPTHFRDCSYDRTAKVLFVK